MMLTTPLRELSPSSPGDVGERNQRRDWEAVEPMLAVCAARERTDNNNPTTTPPMQSFMGGSSFGNLRIFVPSCGIGRRGTRRRLNPALYEKAESASKSPHQRPKKYSS